MISQYGGEYIGFTMSETQYLFVEGEVVLNWSLLSQASSSLNEGISDFFKKSMMLLVL